MRARPGGALPGGARPGGTLLAACAALALASLVPLAAARAASPRAICASLGTDDALRPLPPSLVRAARQAFGYTGMTAAEVEHMTVFRCMDEAVLLCSWGANLACGKAETSPSLPAAADWCVGNRDASSIPAYVTGHDSVFQWSCHDGAAIPSHPAPLDARGFFQSNWVPAQ
jgi:hypothetical protein